MYPTISYMCLNMFEILKVDSLQNILRLLLRDGWGIFFWIRLLEGAAGYQIDFVENPLLRIFRWSLFSILWWAAILGSLDFYFVVNLGALFWMDLYFVESLSLQNHLSAPWPEMSKGILLCGHAIRAIHPYCRVQAKPNWAKTTRRLWAASTTWQCSSKPRGVWRMLSLFTARL